MHVLDNGGNLADACMLCALAALMAFRRPDTQVAAGGAGADDGRARVTVLSPSVREPVPLSLHHLPLAVSFALFQACIVCNLPVPGGMCFHEALLLLLHIALNLSEILAGGAPSLARPNESSLA